MTRLPPRLRSLQTKLALLLCAIIALAFSIVFFYVVPQLRSSLEEQTVNDLERSGLSSSRALQSAMGSDITESQLNELVRAVADRSNARVTLLGVQISEDLSRGGARPQSSAALYVISDSRVEREVAFSHRVAEDAVRRQAVQRGVGPEQGVAAAKVAVPLAFQGRPDWVAVYSRDLSDVAETVALIRRQVVLAALVALVVAMAGGFLVARALACRVRRLEAAADQVAAGSFIEPLPIDAEDEIGQLTRKFNEMQAQLSRLDQARREFIANASHELRTPIFSLGGFAELLQDEDLDPATRHEFLGAMREQVGRLQKLAADLLDLSRLDAGSLEVRTEPVNLSELARDVAGEFTPAIGQHHTDLQLHLPEEVPALCDRERAAQIVRILLDNALRHTPEGARITVSAAREDGTARLAVTDTGPALGGRALDNGGSAQLFERFHTADAARGSGLGLAIARELAERMDGEIALRADPATTVFELGLPAGARGDGALSGDAKGGEGDGVVGAPVAGARGDGA